MKYIVTLNNKQYEVDVTETDAAITAVSSATTPAVSAAPPAPDPVSSAPVADISAGTPVKSPMPGNVLQVRVSVGQQVKAGDVMFVLEAMKMENEIAAPVSGTVKQILAEKGSMVETDAVLAVI